MKPKLKSATLSAIACITLTSCGNSSDGSSLPEDTSSAAVTTTTAVTTTAAATTPEVTTAAVTTVTEDLSLAPEDSSAAEPETPLTEDLFDNIAKYVDVRIDDDRIIQTAVINDRGYSLTIDLSKWEHHTSPEDMVQLSRLFWQCYPRLYERFGEITNAPYDVVLAIENEGYPVAEASENLVHLHDMWLPENPGDYDCITHELGHIVQVGSEWDDAFLEYSSYSELFADVCRYEYPLNGGYFNDAVWTLQTPVTQDSRETSVRFLIWLDYTCSDYSRGIDLMYRFCDICFNNRYPADQWSEAWQDIFRDTELEGKTADEVWKMFTESEFATLDATAEKGGTSELLSRFDIRENVKKTDTEQ